VRVTIPAVGGPPWVTIAPTFTDTQEENMVTPIVIVIFCVVIITAVTVYFPTIYIRKTNKLMAVLEKIESNTRK
jgi:hypothetical protein